MTRSSKKLPKDTNKLAAEIVRLSTGGSTPESITEYLSRIGRKGGLKGGKERAKRLSGEQRSEIASKAAKARWKRG
jgi:hypothetical protein